MLKKYFNFSNPKFTALFYFALFYSFILTYHNLFISRISEWSADVSTYTHHLVDYSFGFCTKLLPGAIYHLFFDNVVPEQLNSYLRIIVLVFFAALSFILARAISLKERKDRKTLLLLFAFYLTGPCTFAIYTEQLGMLDLYWMLFGAAFFFVVDKKYLKFIIPVLYFGTLLVHFSSIVSYIVLYSLILLYEAVTNEDKSERKRYSIVFIISVITVGAAFLYFLINEKSNLVYDMNGFNAEIAKRHYRGGFENKPYTVYFDYAFYNSFDADGDGLNDFRFYPIEHFLPNLGGKLPAGLGSALSKVLSQISFNLSLYKIHADVFFVLAVGVLFMLPLNVFFFIFFGHMVKKSRGIKRLIFLLAILQYFVTITAGVMSSVDLGRWLSHTCLVQFTFALYVILREKEQLEWCKNKISKIPLFAIIVYLAIYMQVIIPAYS